jgi:hypothetical protein
MSTSLLATALICFGLFLLYWTPTLVALGRRLSHPDLRRVVICNLLGFLPLGPFALWALAWAWTLEKPPQAVGERLARRS